MAASMVVWGDSKSAHLRSCWSTLDMHSVIVRKTVINSCSSRSCIDWFSADGYFIALNWSGNPLPPTYKSRTIRWYAMSQLSKSPWLSQILQTGSPDHQFQGHCRFLLSGSEHDSLDLNTSKFPWRSPVIQGCVFSQSFWGFDVMHPKDQLTEGIDSIQKVSNLLKWSLYK